MITSNFGNLVSVVFFPQTLSCFLQTLLAGPYNMMPNNVASSQVHLIMHQLNQCYTQLSWQQNNVQRFVLGFSCIIWNASVYAFGFMADDLDRFWILTVSWKDVGKALSLLRFFSHDVYIVMLRLNVLLISSEKIIFLK